MGMFMQNQKAGALRAYNELFRKENELYHHVADRLGLSDSAFNILYAIYDSDLGCTQKEICTFTGLPKQTVHSSIRKMVEQGYLYTKAQGKVVRVYFTDTGHVLAKRCIEPIQAAEEAAFGVMSKQECDEFLRLFTLYLKGLQDKFAHVLDSQ